MNTLFLRYLKEMQNKGRLKFYENHSLSLVSTFGIGGKARVFVIPYDTDTLCDTVTLAASAGRYIIIGNASNLLFDDRGFSGTVISTARIRAVELTEIERVGKIGGCERVISALCGVSLPQLSAFALRNGITGFEGLCSIPATVGGALCQNAGAYGQAISDTLIAYEAFYPDKREKRTVFVGGECFSYRKSPIGKQGEAVLCAYFRAESAECGQILEKMEKNKACRLASQPIGARSAGSYFRRPEGADGKSAGELIDKSGLKGLSVGGAEVSVKHANFIINKSGSATACDVLRLADTVKKTVFLNCGVMLCEEVEFIPRHGRRRKR
jgi:UDP-N-acetylmuramate dehydrogenase